MKPETKQAIKCFFGFHPRNPRRHIPEEAYYIVSCHNGETPWEEKCPECDQWWRPCGLEAEVNAKFESIRIRNERIRAEEAAARRAEEAALNAENARKAALYDQIVYPRRRRAS